jgi:hypothetical protein
MKAIFPSALDGDLLKLVHLSNGFRMLEEAKPYKVGDVCKAEARILSVTNTNEGKIVKVKGHVCCGGKPVIEVVSAFLYRGWFTDYHNTLRQRRSRIISSRLQTMPLLEYFSRRRGSSGTTTTNHCWPERPSFSEFVPRFLSKTRSHTAMFP